MLLMVLFFIVAPIIELFVIVEVASAIGVLPTVALLVLISLVGAWLTKVEGLGVLRRMAETIDAGQLPADEALDGIMVASGGVLMLLPGFISGIIGLLLLLPPVRYALRPVGRWWVRRRFERSQARLVVFGAGVGGGPGESFGGRGVYDVESHRRPDDDGSRPRGAPPELGA
jgi:UPF0716 protein FxsA